MKRIFLNTDHRLRWPWQCAVLFALFFVLSALAEVAVPHLFIAAWPDNLDAAYLLSDILINVLLSVALVFGFRWVTGRRAADIGLQPLHGERTWQLALGLSIGAGAISLMAVLLHLTGDISLRPGGQAGYLLLHVLYFVSVSVVEEVLTRGALQHVIAGAGHPWLALVIPSVFFGLLHLGNESVTVLAVVNTTLAGLLLALYVHRDGNLWRAMGFHFTWNYFLSIVYGMTVSGADFSQGQFFNTVLRRQSLFNGGAYGVEGGWLATAVLLALIVWEGFFLLRAGTANTRRGPLPAPEELNQDHQGG